MKGNWKELNMDNNLNNMFSAQAENRNCGCGENNGCGCNSEILFFIIIFLLLFTNFGCCNRV